MSIYNCLYHNIMNKPIPDIIIADDHDLFRDAISSMLETEGIAHVIAEAADGKKLIELMGQFTPDIILMDIDMPVVNGIEATKAILHQNSDIKIMALSMFGDQQYYYQMIEAGASGFVLKTSNKNELIEAIQKIHTGQNYFSNELLRRLVVKLGEKKFGLQGNKVVEFNDSEINILKNMCLGLSTAEIAENINLSEKTVENYRVKLLQKTNCKNAVSLVVYAIKNGIIEI